jgi:hypothetical protein
LRRLQPENQHVFGEPALLLRKHGSDPQGEALLAEQRIAAIAGAERPDRFLLRKLDDVLLRIVRPHLVLLARLERFADRVQRGHELAVLAQHIPHRSPDAGHDAHVDDDIRGIRDLDADVRDMRSERAHGEGDDVHRTASHAAVEQLHELRFHLGRIDPVVVGSGIVLAAAADESAILHASDIGRMRAGKITVGPQL